MNLDNRQLVALVLFVAVSGCSSEPTPLPKLNTTRGEVAFADRKMNVELADHAIVQFHPKDGGSPDQKIWGSLIEGKYSLITEEGGEKIPGAPEGDYVVTIVPAKHNQSKISSKYSDPKTSELTAHIDEGDNEIPLFEIAP